MQVANIIEEGRIGGPQIRNLMVASTLKKKNVEVTLIFPTKNSKDLKKQCNLLNVKYLSLSLREIKKSFFGVFMYVLLFPFEVIKLALIFKKKKYDLVHVSGGSLHNKGVFAAKLAGIKVIWELNDTYAPKIVKKIFSFTSRLANGFIFASEKTKKYYSQLIPNKRKIFLIQSPVNTNLFNPRAKLNTDKFFKNKKIKKKIVIGTVGNINPNKDHITFIKTATKLLSFEKELIFVIIGPVYNSQKNYFKYLLKFIKMNKIKNIHFIGSRKDIRPMLKKIDIYVCSSSNESSPLAVWEAMAMENPVISTNVGDISKFIKNGKNGYIVKVGNADSLANKIIKLLKNTKLRKQFGKYSRKIVRKKLNLDLCARYHQEAYFDMLV